ncbi:hypothetical protein KLP40_14680 [Hymenobacter sp. NST-14]|uniref:hypothetical protein n=1 Tax=Hymenobacter piscis TaxID=2839984 RepID=UPI001C028C23|nr:hypothetical protein [Hymenobacter piscis]MBT9394414.1 hypothetical protein [Hymenobacter piscis]
MDKQLLALFILLLAGVVLVLIGDHIPAWQKAALMALALLGARPLADGFMRYVWLTGLSLSGLVLALEVAKQFV